MRYIDNNEEDDGRVLSEAEYVQALKNRDDIFLMERGTRFRIIAALSLALSMAGALWLGAVPPAKIAPEPYSQERMIPVRQARIGHAAFPKEVREEHDGGNVRGTVVIDLKSHADTSLAGRRSHNDISKYSREKTLTAAATPRPEAMVTETDGAMRPLPEARPPEETTGKGQDLVTVQSSSAGTGALDRRDSDKQAGQDRGLIATANTYKRQENYAPAFAAFFRVLKHNPRDTLALTGVGDLFLFNGFLDSAAAFYTAALAVNPRMAVAHKGLGSARFYLSTSAANPRYARRMKIRDPAAYVQSQYDSAIAEYTEAISLDSSLIEALINRGVLRDLRSDHDAAIRDFTRAIKTDPSFADAYCKRAAAYKAEGNYARALEDYTVAVKLGPRSYEFDSLLHFANAYFSRGVVYYKMGNLDKAIADFDSTLALSPKHSLAILNRAIAMSDEKRYDSAIAGYTQAIALLAPLEYEGSRYRAFLNRGNAFLALGKIDDAIGDYKKTLEFPALAAKACWRIAECYALKHDRESAVAWLKKSVAHGFSNFESWKQDPNLAAIRDDREFLDLIKRQPRPL